MPTIKDIASMAGVSRGTVDRVINNRGKVNPKTEKRIREALMLLEYTPSKAGRALAMIKKKIKFGFVFLNNNGTHLYFQDIEKGIRSKAEEYAEYGIEVDIQYSESKDIGHQVELLEHYKTQQYDGVAITPIDDPRISLKIDELTACGIPVVTVSSDINNSLRIAHIGNDYFQSGKIAAGLMNLICQGSANIGIVSGATNILCHGERIRGFQARLSEAYPGLVITACINNHDDNIEGYVKTKEMLAQHPEINALFLATAGIYGVCRLLTEQGLHLPVICYDLLPETKRLVNESIIAATIDQDPYFQGQKALEILFDHVVSGKAPEKPCYLFEPKIIIKENLFYNTHEAV